MRPKRGIYPDFMLKEFVEAGFITGKEPIDVSDDSLVIGPSSIDLTLGDKAYVVAGSATPNQSETVDQMLALLSCSAGHEVLDLTKPCGNVLKAGSVYVAELNESLNLTNEIRGRTNPKSTTGRLDILARVVVDGTGLFDNIPTGYKGRLYLEIHPQTFDIRVRKGDSLSQLRLHTYQDIQDFTLQKPELEAIGQSTPILVDKNGKPVQQDNMAQDG